MKTPVVYAGVLITAIGLLLLLMFIPFTGVSAVDLGKDYDKGDFKSYSDGDKVTVYGTITKVEGNDEKTVLYLDGQDFHVIIEGAGKDNYSVGEEVIIHATVKEHSWDTSWGPFDVEISTGIEYLSATPDDVQSKTMLETAFGAIAVLGFLVIIAGVVKK